MGTNKEEMTTEEKIKLFDEIECALRGVAIRATSEATLPAFLIRNKPEGNAFEHLSTQMLDIHEEAGIVCRDYIECAAEIGKLNAAEMEIRRLLDIAAQSTDTSRKSVKEATIKVMEKYTPAPEHDDKLPNQDLGKVLTEIQHMRCLLDIIEKNIQGKLTEQDVAEMEQNRANWMKDIEKLKQMIGALSN